MASDRGTFELLGRSLALALQPLSEAVKDLESFKQLLFRLGWTPTAVPPAYASLGASVDAATIKLDALPEHPPFPDVLALIQAVKNAFDAIGSISVAPPGVNAAAFIPEIRQRLFELLFTEHLSAQLPAAFNLLSVLNVIDAGPIGGSPGRPPFMRTNFKWGELPAILREPMELPKRVFGWGTRDFDAGRALDLLGELFYALDFPVRFERPDDALVRAYADLPPTAAPLVAKSLVVPFFYIQSAGKDLVAAFALRELPASAGKPPGIVVETQIPQEFPLSMRLADHIGLRLRARAPGTSVVGITVRPGEAGVKYPLNPGTSMPAGGVGVGFDFPPAAPTVLLGSPGGTRLELQGGSVDLGVTAGGGGANVSLHAGLNGLALVISGNGESLFDGFLAKILGDGESRVAFPLGIDLGSRDGIRFDGSGGFDVQVHPHLSLGPIRIDDVDVRLQALVSGPPDVRIDLGANIAGSLGPIDFFVQGIGLRADATFKNGNFGPFDLQLGFLPPTGVGLSVDVGGFKGGGFLILDTAKGEYAGGLELDFLGIVSVKAVGLLTTKFPDGHRGFSLLILISAEFPPIELGFGFTLLGVGGLLGLDRTVDEDALKEGVHQGALDSILFPQNIVANAPRIVNDLRRIFPPAEGHFLVGPMVKFGWGTPTILSLDFGFILDIPRPAFFIIGRLRLGLPFQDLALFDVRVSFAGGVDFSKGQLWFDGTLFDSRLLTFALTGDMAVRLYWKDDANFILTVGGFHPAYTPPPMALGSLQRLGITIFDGNPRLRAETYFAITSNTVQWGTKAELFFGVDVFNVYGFIAYDVLIQFDPFRFIATLSAMLAVRSGSEVLLGIRVDALLEGPTPWHAKGTGHFEISLIISITIDVDFEVTLGDSRHDTLPAVPLLPQLVAAFGDARNWRAVIPAGCNLQVTLRPPADPDLLVLHPFGSLEISQKVAPLDLPIQKSGNQRISDGSVFTVAGVTLGGAPARLDQVRDQFAPAQFIDMSDADKLAHRSFEAYDAGVLAGGGDVVNADYFTRLELGYEVIYIPEPRDPSIFKLAKFLFQSFAAVGAVSQSPLSAAQNAPSVLGASPASLANERYAVASATDLSLRHESLVFSSEAEARAAVTSLVSADPSLESALQVVPFSFARAA
jgi:hypothetical protein